MEKKEAAGDDTTPGEQGRDSALWAGLCSYERALNHLVWLANHELYGKKYAWHRAKEMDKTTVYAGIKDDLTNAMRNAAMAAESAKPEC